MPMNNDIFHIRGLGGRRKLSGTITIGGAKNSATKIMAASLLFKDEMRASNIPEIEDVHRMTDLLTDLGHTVVKEWKGVYRFLINPRAATALDIAIAKRIRSAVVLTGPILARFGAVSFPHPGGCVIGERPIDMFLEGFQKMGAEVRVKNGMYVVKRKGAHLAGANIFLRVPSVTVTETLMMSACLAMGVTVIKNAALEPEVANMAEFLNKCGARISGAGTTTITIRGNGPLHARGGIHTIMPDRIDAGSFLILGALAARTLTIDRCEPAHLESLIDVLRRAGAELDVKKTSITVKGFPIGRVEPVDIKTHEYPGFPTDLQALITVLLTQAKGESLLFETIYESRLAYTESLRLMGADILLMDAHRIMIKGKTPLRGKTLESPDLRAGLAFVIAAIVASGRSVIHNVYNIDRGYENIEERLQSIGVDIKRIRG